MNLCWKLLVVLCFVFVFTCSGMEQQRQGQDSKNQYQTFSINSKEKVSLLPSKSDEDITAVTMSADSWVIRIDDAVNACDGGGVALGVTRSGVTRGSVSLTPEQQLAKTFENLAQKLTDAERDGDITQMQKSILQVLLANLKLVGTETNSQVSQESFKTRLYALGGILGVGALQIAYQIVSQYLNGTLCKDGSE